MTCDKIECIFNLIGIINGFEVFWVDHTRFNKGLKVGNFSLKPEPERTIVIFSVIFCAHEVQYLKKFI